MISFRWHKISFSMRVLDTKASMPRLLLVSWVEPRPSRTSANLAQPISITWLRLVVDNLEGSKHIHRIPLLCMCSSVENQTSNKLGRFGLGQVNQAGLGPFPKENNLAYAFQSCGTALMSKNLMSKSIRRLVLSVQIQTVFDAPMYPQVVNPNHLEWLLDDQLINLS